MYHLRRRNFCTSMAGLVSLIEIQVHDGIPLGLVAA